MKTPIAASLDTAHDSDDSSAATNDPARSESVTPTARSKSITYISGGVFVPSTRFRADAIKQQMELRGWEGKAIYGYGPLDHRIPSGPLRKGYRLACRARRALATASLNVDGPVFIQRLAIPTWHVPEVTLAQRTDRVVFDFDDAIFLDAKQRECERRRKALDKVFRAARHVVAGNQWLASQVPDSCDVSVIPTCLDTDAYAPAASRRREDHVVRIGWIGTNTNFRHLKQLIEPLRTLRRKYKDDIEFCVCSNERDETLFKELDATFVPWSADAEVAILQSFDIGVMPLAEEDWCRGKCSFKLIQYLAVGLASVSSPVGMNCEVVNEGGDGLFAHNGDWVQALDSLIADSALRERIGAEARNTAESRFSLRIAADAYEAIFNKVAE